VEIGRCGDRGVIPFEAILYKIIKEIVGLLCTGGIAQELGNEE
jgi:hypothetical protein